MKEDIKIIQFHLDSDDNPWILLSNGRIFRKTENGGPWFWLEEELLQELIEYLRREGLREKKNYKLTNK